MSKADILKLFDEENPIQKPERIKHSDWKGSSSSVFKTLAASAHTEEERQAFDYYATDPIAAKYLLTLETLNNKIWEPLGEGHLSKVFLENGYDVKSTDLIDRGFGTKQDFLSIHTPKWGGDIVTNPPYSHAKQFVLKSLEIVDEGAKIAMFLKITFLEGKGRSDFFYKNPPIRVWVSSNRINCAKNADFKKMRADGGSAVCYAWFIWEKGFSGETTLKWFN